VAAFSSVRARRVMVVAATPAIVAREFIVMGFSPASARLRLALAMALASVSRTRFRGIGSREAGIRATLSAFTALPLAFYARILGSRSPKRLK